MSYQEIFVEGLGKQYRIGAHEASYRTIRETIVDVVTAPFVSMRSRMRGEPRRSSYETIWALKDVSFEVRTGEVVGIIGPNGAGKTTLLKILSRITKPTEGLVSLGGRVGSLLEVGTGFHPELTGRENIYLNGAILGMRNKEIESKFDEIVDFAGIEKFLDTPVKRYSSGMYVRLAFSVAAHMDPEILLIDEVLSVGDKEFQAKCIGKMEYEANRGRTILFVSHNMGAIQSFCTRGIFIEDGSIKFDGPVDDAVYRYIHASSSSMVLTPPREIAGLGAKLEKVEMCSEELVTQTHFQMTEPLTIVIGLEILTKGNYSISIQIKELNGTAIYHFPIVDAPTKLPSAAGTIEVKAHLPILNLYPGEYHLRVALTNIDSGLQQDIDKIRFHVDQDFNLCSRPLPRQAGLIFALPRWEVNSLSHRPNH